VGELLPETSGMAYAEVGEPTFGEQMKTILLLIGIIVLIVGLFFAGQGLGYIQWPTESFMVSQIKWAYYGAGIAVVGLLLIIMARR
jgi:hypothetical protein